jgi:hypothetical protein
MMAAPAALPMAATIAQAPWFWALWSLPLAALIVGWAGLRRARSATARHAQRRRTQASGDALRTLRSATDPAAAQKVLDEYLTRVLGHPVGGLTRTGRTALLEERGAPASLLARVEACYALVERARFSPAEAADPEATSDMQRDVEAIIRDLDPLLRTQGAHRAKTQSSTTSAVSAGGVQ